MTGADRSNGGEQGADRILSRRRVVAVAGTVPAVTGGSVHVTDVGRPHAISE